MFKAIVFAILQILSPVYKVPPDGKKYIVIITYAQGRTLGATEGTIPPRLKLFHVKKKIEF